MSSSNTVTNDFISGLAGYCIFSEAVVGSNGAGVDPELTLGGSSGLKVVGRSTWDTNLADGFDTGWISVEFNLKPGGGAAGVTWKVGTTTLTYTQSTYGKIAALHIYAAVQQPASASWRNLSVKFYKGGSQTDSFSLRNGPAVDTTSPGSPAAREQILTVTPAASDNDQVIISASIKLTDPSTVLPSVDDLLAQIYVDTDACT